MPKMNEEDIEYLEKNFPKGMTHYRGQAMVLLALARQQGKLLMAEELKEVIELAHKIESEEGDYEDMWNMLLEEISKLINSQQTKQGSFESFGKVNDSESNQVRVSPDKTADNNKELKQELKSEVGK